MTARARFVDETGEHALLQHVHGEVQCCLLVQQCKLDLLAETWRGLDDVRDFGDRDALLEQPFCVDVNFLVELVEADLQQHFRLHP